MFLKLKNVGKIVVIASTAKWLSAARLCFYNASKAAQISFFETLRTEVGLDIGITIVTLGAIESEMTQGDFSARPTVSVRVTTGNPPTRLSSPLPQALKDTDHFANIAQRRALEENEAASKHREAD
ncbi:11-beta-hydroxysteroid dehydrogenase 1b [Quercus suber]|uniref:11-beta-hydroxysteroid dehydrogenase 1b n=1 Tax=Quercus suber TaxID=58331 RepID=A0AAW0LMR8_QUESU